MTTWIAWVITRSVPSMMPGIRQATGNTAEAARKELIACIPKKRGAEELFVASEIVTVEVEDEDEWAPYLEVLRAASDVRRQGVENYQINEKLQAILDEMESKYATKS